VACAALINLPPRHDELLLVDDFLPAVPFGKVEPGSNSLVCLISLTSRQLLIELTRRNVLDGRVYHARQFIDHWQLSVSRAQMPDPASRGTQAS
jgi:hypothetical protein